MHGIVVHAQSKGWMETDNMKIRVEKVWECRPEGLLRKRSLLVWDSFNAHFTDEINE